MTPHRTAVLFVAVSLVAALGVAASVVRTPVENLEPGPADELAAAFRAKVALNPIELDHDPYGRAAGGSVDGIAIATAADTQPVCAVRYEGQDRIRYRLETFAAEDEARSAGYAVTHAGRCGTCSTLQDLAAYLSQPDLTTPVRWCTVAGVTSRRTMRCLRELGLTEACARTWYYNALNTRRHCFGTCMRSWMAGESSNVPGGALNACLRCDEEKSGPVFKAVAGRTRRNSGIRSSIERSRDEVYALTHDYY